MVFINENDFIGQLLVYATNNITGSLFLTLLMGIMIILALAFMFRIQLEWTVIFVLPFILTVSAYTTDFLPILGASLIYLAILFAKNLIVNG